MSLSCIATGSWWGWLVLFVAMKRAAPSSLLQVCEVAKVRRHAGPHVFLDCAIAGDGRPLSRTVVAYRSLPPCLRMHGCTFLAACQLPAGAQVSQKSPMSQIKVGSCGVTCIKASCSLRHGSGLMVVLVLVFRAGCGALRFVGGAVDVLPSATPAIASLYLCSA